MESNNCSHINGGDDFLNSNSNQVHQTHLSSAHQEFWGSNSSLQPAPRNRNLTTQISQNVANPKPSKSYTKPGKAYPSSLKIGLWENVALYRGDLVARFYFSTKKLVWQVFGSDLLGKFVIPWKRILSMRFMQDNQQDILEIELSEPPMFYLEDKRKKQLHNAWTPSSDFTCGEASQNRRHCIKAPVGELGQYLRIMVNCDKRLLQLIQRPFPSMESPYFHSELQNGNAQQIDYLQQQPSSSIPFDGNAQQNRYCRQLPSTSISHNGNAQQIAALQQLPSSSIFHNGNAQHIPAVQQLPSSSISHNGNAQQIGSLQQLPSSSISHNGDAQQIGSLQQLPNSSIPTNRNIQQVDYLPQLSSSSIPQNGNVQEICYHPQLPSSSIPQNGNVQEICHHPQLPSSSIPQNGNVQEICYLPQLPSSSIPQNGNVQEIRYLPQQPSSSIPQNGNAQRIRYLPQMPSSSIPQNGKAKQILPQLPSSSIPQNGNVQQVDYLPQLPSSRISMPLGTIQYGRPNQTAIQNSSIQNSMVSNDSISPMPDNSSLNGSIEGEKPETTEEADIAKEEMATLTEHFGANILDEEWWKIFIEYLRAFVSDD